MGDDFRVLFEALAPDQQTRLLGPLLEAGVPGRGNEARLKRWWLTSSGIHWGVGGDFDQCVRLATRIFGEHGIAIDPKSWCAALHKEATGARPGHAPGEHHESAEEAPMGDMRLMETVTITEAAAQEARATGEFPIQFISPGWGSSGYYSPETLAEAAAERVIPAGTHMYADHPTRDEHNARPERSIKDLMAVTTEDARLSPSGALVGRARVVPQWQPFVEAVRDHIGVSIRGDAKDIREGEAEGRKGRIIEGLAHVHSVDFVTRAGRGGRVLQLLESAASEHADIAEDLDTALYEAKYDAEQMRALLAKGHAIKNDQGEPSYPIDDAADLANAIRAVGRGGASHDRIRAYIRRRAKALGKSDAIPDSWGADGSMSESDTTDVPATRPDGSTTTTESHKEMLMGQKTIEESEYTRLTEAAGRVETLEAENKTLAEDLTKVQGELTEAKASLRPSLKAVQDQLVEARRENAVLRAKFGAGQVIDGLLAEALVSDGQKATIRAELLEAVKVTDNGDLDVEALTKLGEAKIQVAENVGAEYLQAFGVGQPRGLGNYMAPMFGEQVAEHEKSIESGLSSIFGLSEAAAKTAVKGR